MQAGQDLIVNESTRPMFAEGLIHHPFTLQMDELDGQFGGDQHIHHPFAGCPGDFDLFLGDEAVIQFSSEQKDAILTASAPQRNRPDKAILSTRVERQRRELASRFFWSW